MKGNKIVATIVVLIMLFSTMMVLNKLDINFVEKASATMGVDDFQGSPSGADILNMTEPNLIYGTTRTLTFNGTLITESCQIYYPTYHSEWDAGSSKYEVWTNWTQYSGVSLGATATEPTASVDLDYAGLWIVAASISPEFWKVNMSNMSIYEESAWENVTGWFWVNSSSWTVSLSKSTVYYDKNESLTITVKDAAGDPITDAAFVDIWNIADGAYSLRYHKVLDSTANGVWTITGENMYKDIWHNKGAGIYTVSAYADVSPGHTEATLIYGESGDSDYNGIRGYNTTFGNTTIWLGRFSTTGTYTQIRGWDGNPVLIIPINGSAGTTYKWDTCGPFNPPEYWADYENFTVKAGVPTITVTNSTQFWNSSATEEVKLTVYDYDSNNLTFSTSDVKLYNKSNNPSRSGSTPISSGHYNVTIDSNMIKITPNGTTGNRWGWNSTTTWAAKGKIYIVIAKDSAGNASEEWNGTAEMTLTTPAAEFKWIDDDGTDFTDDNTDGVIPYIPDIAKVPLDIKFQLVGSDYTYWGDTSAGETELQAKENITISGDSIFTGTLDKMPNVEFLSSTTWKVPIIPTMGSNGGEITITARAWNKTITAKLSIGGTNYWQNGSVVTVTPNEFKIDAENKTLNIDVEWANGGSNRGATVYLFYIDDGTAGGNDGEPIGSTTTNWIDKIVADENGVYSMGFNRTQQTANQTEVGLTDIKAPRNLTLYVTTGSGGSGYGYARISMLPMNDLEVEIYPTTFMAGYEYDYFYINTTFVGNNNTPSTETVDLNNFYVQIYDSEGNDVTDTLLNAGGYTSTDLDGDYTLELSSVYITEPGIYTVYAFNNTHDSTDHNATFEVKQVEVTCDMSPFIWSYDDNISATFTVTYEGNPINGTLRIDNISLTTDYNKTYTNTSFDGSDDANTGNDSIEIDEGDLINGVVTINDITADYLPPNRAMENITFWFLPESPYDAAFARAIGRVPVEVPTVTPDPEYIPLGRTTKVYCTATGRGETLSDVFIRLHGQGFDQNGTTDVDGRVAFSVTPASTGNISIDVGETGRTLADTVVYVVAWIIDVDVVAEVDEGEQFTVTVTKEGTTDVVVGATVTIKGVGTDTTDSNGQVTFTAPDVTSDRTYTIKVTATGYAPDPDTNTITVINIPRLTIVLPDEVQATTTFEVAVADDTGGAIVGAIITFNEKTYTTGVNGIAKLTAPKTKGDYPIKATFGTYVEATGTVTVTAAPGIPGFELLTLIAALGVAFILFRRRRR